MGNGNRYRGRVVVRGGGYGYRGRYRGGYRGYGYRGYGYRGFVPPILPVCNAYVVAVAAMLGATAAVSVSADELGDQTFAACFGALVQHSAPLKFTKPSRTHACFYLASGMRVNMRSIAVQVALCRLLPGPASELGPKK